MIKYDGNLLSFQLQKHMLTWLGGFVHHKSGDTGKVEKPPISDTILPHIWGLKGSS